MNLEHIKTILKVIEYGSFAKAAEEIPCAQSSVSRQVASVEDYLGITILVRSGKGKSVVLTQDGIAIIPYLETVVANMERAVDISNNLHSHANLGITIGISPGVTSSIGETYIKRRIYSYIPDTMVKFREGDIRTLRELLEHNGIDAMLYSIPYWGIPEQDTPAFSPWSDRLTAHFLGSSPLGILLKTSHPQANKTFIDFEKLKDMVFYSNHSTSEEKGLYDFFFHCCCDKCGFQPKIVVETFPTIPDKDLKYYKISRTDMGALSLSPSLFCSFPGISQISISNPYYSAAWYLIMRNTHSYTLPLTEAFQSIFKDRSK